MERVWVVTGCNRGIGQQLVKELTGRGNKVICTVRDLSKHKEVLLQIPGVMCVEELDVSSEESVKTFGRILQEANIKINGIINNAGIFVKRGLQNEEDYQSSLFSLSPELFMSHFQVNAMGPFLVVRELFKILDFNVLPLIITIGSAMGSYDKLNNHRSAHYRVSKNAAHMITKLFALELPNCCFVNLHPGWVKTDMGSEKAPLKVEKSVNGLVNVIEQLKLEDSGKFFDYKGNNLQY